MRYNYINSVLDAYPTVERLAVDAVPLQSGPSIYEVITGPVPAGEQSIPGRVTVEQMPSDAAPFLCIGYDAAGTLVCQFFA